MSCSQSVGDGCRDLRACIMDRGPKCPLANSHDCKLLQVAGVQPQFLSMSASPQAAESLPDMALAP